MSAYRFVALLAALLIGSCHCVYGDVFQRDWKIPGDGLLTFDNVNNREWLDLPLQFDLPEPRYENVTAELDPGGRFAGFVVANRNDVLALAVSAGIDVQATSFDVNGVAVGHLIDLLGATRSSEIGFKSSMALISDTFPFGTGQEHIAAAFDYSPVDQRAKLGFIAGRSDGFPSAANPVYLVRQVPEPMSLWSNLIATVISILYARRWA